MGTKTLIHVSFLLAGCASFVNRHNVVLHMLFICVLKVCNLWCDTCVTSIYPVEGWWIQSKYRRTGKNLMSSTVIYICCSLKLVLVQNFSNWFNFYFLLLCSHYHNVEQWQIKLKPVQKSIKSRKNLNHNIYI